MKRALVILCVLAAAGCGIGSDSGYDPDAGASGDAAPQGCAIAFDPVDPVASSTSRIRAYLVNIAAQGVPSFDWVVSFGSAQVTFTPEASDGSQIGFLATAPGIYDVSVAVSGALGCSGASASLNVRAPGANQEVFRLRTVPAPGVAPPQEQFLDVRGGADATRHIALDRGIEVSGLVRNSATSEPEPAYLKFMPTSMPTAFSEVFAGDNGVYSLRLLATNHQVLVIPRSPTLAPKLVAWNIAPMTTQLEVGPGTLVTGTVRGPNSQGLADATVQLYAGGVPSTAGKTAPDGTFSVRADVPAGTTMVTVRVTPPPPSGLPRLEATSTFALDAPMQIQYSSALATCDLANVPVRRAGVARAGANVTIVGTLAGTAGTIAGVAATNTVRASATADGAGRLPGRLVPRGALFAVTSISAIDHAVAALDTSACSVAQVDAPAMTTVGGTTRKDAMTVLGNVRIEAEPLGMLALAGVPPVQVASSASGAFSLGLASGGRYNVRFTDPQARAAPLVTSDVAPGGVPTSAVLPRALAISGDVRVTSSANPVVGASVQVLCASCSGLDAARPIAETATDTVSKYRIAVPDPGTM